MPPCLAAVRSIDKLHDIQRESNECMAERRASVRRNEPNLGDRPTRLDDQQTRKTSNGNNIAKAMDYMLKHWALFAQFLHDGRICLTNNDAERALCGIVLAGSPGCLPVPIGAIARRGDVSLIVSAKMNNIDPQAWLVDLLGGIAEHSAPQLQELLPWIWAAQQVASVAAWGKLPMSMRIRRQWGLIVRLAHAACLFRATVNHARPVAEHGLLLDNGRVSLASAPFWTSLSLLDPLAVILIVVRPNAGVLATAIIIIADVVHSIWVPAR